ncbi:fimbria/pilus outer membrane usher protein [Providencia rettgeri]|uniref:fimbria/pilus outer membrane usher protein n=1 Tax=Providencia rettgeri TaxID=587 RepID=UPI0032DBBD7B
MKKLLFFFMFHVSCSYSQDYFNPLFLGSDVDSIDDLSYLSDGNNIPPGNYLLSVMVGDKFIKNINIKFKESANKKVVACFTQDNIDIIPFNDVAISKFTSVNHNDECIDIQKYIPEFSYDVDISKLRLILSVPQIYLQSINSTLANESDWDDGITALITNYNINGSYSKNRDMDDYLSSFVYLNNRLNIGSWRFNASTYFSKNKVGSSSTDEWNTSNIFITKSINSIKSMLTVGQSSLGSVLFDTNTYVGISLATFNQMLPESEKGYSPIIKGIAESRSKITIKQYGNIIYQDYINPGPYSIDNLSSVGSSGDYEVELTSEQGVVTRSIVPYSTLPNLLRAARYNYLLSVGRLDITNAHKSKFFQGSYSYGLPLGFTLYSGAQIANNYQAIGLGLAKDIGRFGALSFDSIQAKSKIGDDQYVGGSYRGLYAKAFSETGTNFQLTGYRYSTSDYYSLAEANYKHSTVYDVNNNVSFSLSERRKNSFQVNLTQSIGDYGQLYLWGNINSYWGNNKKSQNIQLGWNKTFTELNNVILSSSYNRNTYNGKVDNVFYVSMSMPLTNSMDKNRIYLSNSTSYTDAKYNSSTGLYGTALDNKLNYNVYQTDSNNMPNSSNLSLRYKASVTEISAGASLSGSSQQIDYGLNGSVLLHQGGLILAREAHDTAILVEAKGATGAQIDGAGENLTIGRNGYALVPYATPYHYNDVSLSEETFSTDYAVDAKVLKVAPTHGAISKVVFDVRKGYNFLVSLNYNGQNVKFGTLVTSVSANNVAIVNDDSTVYLTGVQAGSEYIAKIDKDTSCSFTINYNERDNLEGINQISLTCR